MPGKREKYFVLVVLNIRKGDRQMNFSEKRRSLLPPCAGRVTP